MHNNNKSKKSLSYNGILPKFQCQNIENLFILPTIYLIKVIGKNNNSIHNPAFIVLLRYRIKPEEPLCSHTGGRLILHCRL